MKKVLLLRYICLVCSVALIYEERIARGLPLLECMLLSQKIYPHAAAVGLSPYFVNISSFQSGSTYSYSPGSTYKVILQSRNTSFEGFLMQASLFNGTIVGAFQLQNLSMLQYSSCSTSQGSVTHNSTFNGNYFSVVLNWHAPTKAGVGPVIFRFRIFNSSPAMTYGSISEVIHESSPPYILVGNERYVRKIEITGDHRLSLVASNTSVFNTTGIGYHLRRNFMYRADQISTPRILCGWLETTSFPTTLLILPVNELILPSSIAVDWINDKLYWTDEGKHRIEVAELLGARRSVVIATVVQRPRGLVVDPMNGWMYWVDSERGVVERASMDGSSHTVLHKSGVTTPTSLALDRDAQTLYWIDSGRNRLESSSVYGSNRKLLITGSAALHKTHGMAVFQNKIYWTEQSNRMLHSISISSPDLISNVWEFSTNDDPYEIAVVAPSEQPASTKSNPCDDNNGGCSQLCLLSSTASSGYRCACVTGLQLAADGRNCFWAEVAVASFSISGISNCSQWISTDRFEKLFYISYAMAEGVESMCHCGFTSVNILTFAGQLGCQDNCVHVQLYYHAQLNTSNITAFVEQWTKTTSTFTVLGTQFTVCVDTDNSVSSYMPSHAPTTYLASPTSTRDYLASPTTKPETSPVLSLYLFIGIALGAAFVFVCCTFIAVICIVLCITKKRKRRSLEIDCHGCDDMNFSMKMTDQHNWYRDPNANTYHQQHGYEYMSSGIYEPIPDEFEKGNDWFASNNINKQKQFSAVNDDNDYVPMTTPKGTYHHKPQQ